MTNITADGYIVHDNEGLIHGYGATANDAWMDMMLTFQNARIELLEDDEEPTDRDGSWTRMSGLTTTPATAAMLRLVKDHGGNCTWGKIGIVACTVAEEEADAT
jgi:hypothetical protein